MVIVFRPARLARVGQISARGDADIEGQYRADRGKRAESLVPQDGRLTGTRVGYQGHQTTYCKRAAIAGNNACMVSFTFTIRLLNYEYGPRTQQSFHAQAGRLCHAPGAL